MEYFPLNEDDKAVAALKKAAESSPDRQEPWFIMAMFRGIAFTHAGTQFRKLIRL
jgi:Tfp pilus assembly protein PilF